ncbi:unnamed protein product, partial [Arabidopsis halleri]
AIIQASFPASLTTDTSQLSDRRPRCCGKARQPSDPAKKSFPSVQAPFFLNRWDFGDRLFLIPWGI